MPFVRPAVAVTAFCSLTFSPSFAVTASAPDRDRDGLGPARGMSLPSLGLYVTSPKVHSSLLFFDALCSRLSDECGHDEKFEELVV
jgi:hypothetical protein